ncbi:DUF47 family protein [Candidatus Bathyarchaeota archaeon]|nr:DUF47 family protein [Candidatus Bathyarchaeota archaeon]
MVFPVESEDRTMRNLLMLSQDHMRLVIEMFRKVLVMIDGLKKGDYKMVDENFMEIGKLHADSLNLKRSILKELHESGGVLVNREDFYRLISKSRDLTDYIESIAYRIGAISSKRWKVPKEVLDGLVKISDASFQTLTRLRESLISLSFNAEKAIELTKDVDEGERTVDEIYRNLYMTLFTSKTELPIILSVKDVLEEFDLMIDAAEEEADLIRLLAL